MTSKEGKCNTCLYYEYALFIYCISIPTISPHTHSLGKRTRNIGTSASLHRRAQQVASEDVASAEEHNEEHEESCPVGEAVVGVGRERVGSGGGFRI